MPTNAASLHRPPVQALVVWLWGGGGRPWGGRGGATAGLDRGEPAATAYPTTRARQPMAPGAAVSQPQPLQSRNTSHPAAFRPAAAGAAAAQTAEPGFC